MSTAEPVWAIAEHFPRQGQWTEHDYLALPEGFPRIELSDGRLEFLPVPNDDHQAILGFLYELLRGHAKRVGGWTRMPGTRIQTKSGFRAPDVAYLSPARGELRGKRFWTGADVAVEVVSSGAEDRARDYVKKRREYARAGIAEYWIVDPDDEVITVLKLAGKKYVEHGKFRRGERMTSATLADVSASVDEILDAE